MPGGAFIDEGIYWIDFFRYLTGSDIVAVEARMANLVHKDIDVEDWGLATFTLANGVVATLEASWTINAPRKSGPSPKQNSVVRFEAVGSRGEIVDQLFRSPGRGVLAAGAADWVFERHAEPPASHRPRRSRSHISSTACSRTRRPSRLCGRRARRSWRPWPPTRRRGRAAGSKSAGPEMKSVNLHLP